MTNGRETINVSLGGLAWEWSGSVWMHRVFPINRPGFRHCWDWGEPFCFRCGFLAPVKDCACFPERWSDSRRFHAAWDGASGWLDRAHLRDDCAGGRAVWWNLVPLCHKCHSEQPNCSTWRAGVDFVNSDPGRNSLVEALLGHALYERHSHAAVKRQSAMRKEDRARIDVLTSYVLMLEATA